MGKYTDMSDKTLIKLALIAEDGAFDELLERYEDSVLEKGRKRSRLSATFFPLTKKNNFFFSPSCNPGGVFFV